MKLKHKGDETLEISQRILAHLIDNPDTRHTVNGIAEWWLLQKSTESIKAAQNLITDCGNMKVIANQIDGDKDAFEICDSFFGFVGARIGFKKDATEAGQQVGENAGDVSEKIEDAIIPSAIKMELANDKSVSASNINVVDGIRSVHSNLVIPSRN
jgi:hypothetical protein